MTSPAKLYQCGSESRYGCEILHDLKLETKRKNILGLILTFVEITREKLVVGAF